MDFVTHSPHPAIVLDDGGRVCQVNEPARLLVGSGADESHLSDLIGAPAMQSVLAHLQGSGDPTTVHATLGSGRRVILTVSPLTSGGAILWLVPHAASADRVLTRLVAHTPGAGQDFFEQLVVHLASKLGTKVAMVGTFAGERRVHSLALCVSGSLVDPVDYDVTNAPCAQVMNDDVCYYPSGLTSLFPDTPILERLGVDAYLGVPLLDPSGHALGVLALLHDAPLDQSLNPVGLLTLFANRAATEVLRLRAQEEAERQRAFVEGLIDQVGALVVVLDAEGRVLRANRAVSEVTGWAEQELIGRTLDETTARDHVTETVQTLIAERGRSAAREQTWFTPDGQERHIRWDARVLTNTDLPGEHVVLLSGVDLTALEMARRERDRLQDRLRSSQRLESLGRLAGGVAHDFNNLLLAIIGYADLIEGDPEDTRDVRESAEEIRRAADQAAALTRQLLAFGRKEHLDRRAMDLRDVIRNASAVIRPLLAPHVDLEIVVPERDLPVVADSGRLEQVVVNLAVNARDAMDGRGTLKIRARLLDESRTPEGRGALVELRVQDSGSGIPDDVLPHIFEPFFTTKELGRGTGLGLASVYGTVQQHGGSLDVETSPEGTTFTIHLPAGTPRGPAVSEVQVRPAEGLRILVAEDDDHVRTLVVRVLREAGWTVDAFPDGVMAWEAFARHPERYSVVFADVMMPRLAGTELATRVRGRSDVPILLTSGFVANLEGLPDGVQLLLKPYLPDELISALEQASHPVA